MKKISSLAEAEQAKVFGDYLTSLGIENQVDEVDGGYEVWIHGEEDLEQAKSELERFLEDPNAEQYKNAKKTARKLTRQKEFEEEQRRRNFVDVRAQNYALQGNQVTLILIIISVIVFALQASSNQLIQEIIMRLYIDDPYSRTPLFYFVTHGEIWRLFTPIFMHGGPFHIIFNMFWLFSFGSIIESKKGPKFLILLVLFIAAFSNIAQYVAFHPNFLGMSGVNYGLLGYIWMKMRYQPYENIQINPSYILILMIWLLLGMLGFIGHVANFCHLGGLISGMAVVYLPLLLKKKRN